MQRIKIQDIKPADYNPRKITDTQFEILKKSLQEIGFVVPILVNKANNTIIAGHQRTKAATAIGIKEVPFIYVKNLGIGDEIKFNQIHNAIDVSAKNNAKINTGNFPKEQFLEIENVNFKIGATNAPVLKEICKLCTKYGNVLSCVICRGEVLLGNDYVKACQLLGIKVNSYICDDEKYDIIINYFSKQYGSYNYNNIKRQTYVQGLAQMHRNVEKNKDIKKQNKSSLYEHFVLPYLQSSGKRQILDFGCGKGAYINFLKTKGYKAVGVEFYNNNGSAINATLGNQQIDELIEYLKTNKKFDVVVCDSVLNSVDSIEAETAVITCLNLFCNETLFISGIPIDAVLQKTQIKKDVGTRLNYLKFLDENNFTAIYRKGQWYFQHYNDMQSITEKLEKLGFKIEKISWQKYGTSFQIQCKKVKELTKEQYIQGINFEFNLPLPNGKTYNRHKDVLKVLGL